MIKWEIVDSLWDWRINSIIMEVCMLDRDTGTVNLLHSEWPKLHGVFAVLSATGSVGLQDNSHY